MSDTSSAGYGEPTSFTSEANRFDFGVEQKLGRVRTITPVTVIACSINNEVAGIGTVDVKPLVNMVDGIGANSTQHAVIYGLPYVRIQGGTDGIINDPKPGDTGLALICDRDISNVKAKNGAFANPGSRRRFDFSDGVYLGQIIAGAPVQYMRFGPSGGISVIDKFLNQVLLSSTGTDVIDKNGNVLTMTANGISAQDVSGNVLSMVPGGVSIVDLFGNVIGTSGTGFGLSDISGHSVSATPTSLTLASGSTTSIVITGAGIAVNGSLLITGTITATGAITAGFGGGDQVGLQTHTHPANGSPPTPGT